MTDRARLARRFTGQLSVAMIGANVLGALVVYTYLTFVLPERPSDSATATLGNTVFAAINLPRDLAGGLDVAVTVAAGGATTCALSYLLAERVLRPLVAESMRGEREPPPVVLGVRRRVLLSWALGTGIPLAGIALATAPDGRPEPVGPLPVLFLAKTAPGRVLADGAVVAAAGAEAQAWQQDGEAVLRGRSRPTRLARPR